MLRPNPSFKGIIPFLVFIVLYLGVGIYFEILDVPMAFYQIPGPIAIFIGILTAFLLFSGSVSHKFDTLVAGCGDSNIVIMCIIYLLAGSFATVSKAMGGVESISHFGLSIIPPQYIVAGIFIIGAVMSTAIGTSVGTVVAVAPIAIELAAKSGVPQPLMLAAVMGGAMFGDDMSIISDTTIAGARTLGCRLEDNIRANIAISIPPAVITIILYLIFGKPSVSLELVEYQYNLFNILPYVFVLVTAILGVNVFIVLTGGVLVAGTIGILNGSFNLLSFISQVYRGFNSMNEIFVLSFLTGGLSAMVNKAGGIEWLFRKIDSLIIGRKSAEFGIGMLVLLTDLAIANNTVAIIISGPIAKKIALEHKVDIRRASGLISVFSCIGQGLIPYGAQMLILLSFTKGDVRAVDVMSLLWYQQLLIVFTILSIYVPFYKVFLKSRKKKIAQ